MSSGATVDRLRADIDRGLTGDKVAFSDPALAPLGTDEEAAGTPLTRCNIADAHRMETRHAAAVAERAGLGDAWILVAFILFLAAIIVAWGVIAS